MSVESSADDNSRRSKLEFSDENWEKIKKELFGNLKWKERSERLREVGPMYTEKNRVGRDEGLLRGGAEIPGEGVNLPSSDAEYLSCIIQTQGDLSC